MVYNHIITLPAQIEALCTHHRSFSLCCISKISCFVFKGLTRPHHYPVMFHCIFISKQSAKFKSPRKLVCLLVLHNDHVPKLLSRQAYLGCNRRRILSWPTCVCHDIFLSFCRDKMMFVTTKVLSWHTHFFCHDKNVTCGSSCQWYAGPLHSTLYVCLSLCVSSPYPPMVGYCRCRT